MAGVLVALLFGFNAPANGQDSTSAQAERMSGECAMMESGGCQMGAMQMDGASSDSTSGGMGCMMHGNMGAGMQGDMQGGMQHGENQGMGMQHGANQSGMQGGMATGMGGCQMMSMDADSSTFSPQTVGAIGEALQDEFRSEALYQRVLDDHGDVLPFRNIVNAERRHSSHLIALLDSHGEMIPEPKWTADNSPSFDSVDEACTASVTAEIENVAIYDRLLELDLPEAVRSTFEHLRMISQEHHLPAFKRCAAR
jgi:hypothetical protein